MSFSLDNSRVSRTNRSVSPISVVDLFCGVGGMTHGLAKEGLNVVAGIDNDASCKFAYERNNRARFIQKDVRELSAAELVTLYPDGHLRVLVGCAPCQPFSGYTNRKSEDDKWNLLYAFAELIEEVQPDIVSMENVPGLEKFKSPPVLNDFVQKLNANDYHVSSQIVYCPDYGIPQTRTRLVLLASKFEEIALVNKTHHKSQHRTVADAIGKLEEIEDGTASSTDPLHRAAKLSDMNKRRIKATPAAGSWKDWRKELILKCHSKKTGKSYGSVYGRMKWDAPAPTMTTLCTGIGNGRFGHPDQDRAISLREAAIFQTFPKYYRFNNPKARFSAKAISRQIGNAVPVRLGRIVGRSIRQHLEALNG